MILANVLTIHFLLVTRLGIVFVCLIYFQLSAYAISLLIVPTKQGLGRLRKFPNVK